MELELDLGLEHFKVLVSQQHFKGLILRIKYHNHCLKMMGLDYLDRLIKIKMIKKNLLKDNFKTYNFNNSKSNLISKLKFLKMKGRLQARI